MRSIHRAAHAKWIISADGKNEGDNVVALTHEQLAALLGSASYTSRVIQTFKAEGFWRPAAARSWCVTLRRCASACLCNESVKNHFEEVLRGCIPPRSPPR